MRPLTWIVLALCLAAGAAMAAPARPEVHVTTHNCGRTWIAVYELRGSRAPLELLDRVPGAVYWPSMNRFLVPLPPCGLPPLRFRVGTEEHTSPSVYIF